MNLLTILWFFLIAPTVLSLCSLALLIWLLCFLLKRERQNRQYAAFKRDAPQHIDDVLQEERVLFSLKEYQKLYPGWGERE